MAKPINSSYNFDLRINNKLEKAQFSSPLKRKVSRVYDSIENASSPNPPTKLMRPIRQVAQTTCYEDLPYGFKTAVSPIEACLVEKVHDSSLLHQTRQRIIAIGENPHLSDEIKNAELGVLYYYLMSEKPLPQTPSFLEARLAEIMQEVAELRTQHKQLCDKQSEKRLASGYVIYIQRALVRMIFTNQGELNLAGCYAVKALLHSSLSSFLAEEHRSQILNIVQRLIGDVDFQKLFSIDFPVHPDLAKLILIDLKLPPTQQMHCAYLRWDMLLALFSIVGQANQENNCFAYATLCTLIRQNPDVLLKLLMEILQTGKMNFEGVELPILKLMDCKKKHAGDFRTRLDGNKVAQLTSYSVACHLLEVNPPEHASSAYPLSLTGFLEASFGKESEYAKEIILSHKHNLLQQILLGTLHFAALNSHEWTTFRSQTYASWKRSLASKVFDLLFEEYKVSIPSHIFSSSEFHHFFDSFRDAFSKTFYLADFFNGKQILKRERVTFEFHSQGFVNPGNLGDYLPFMQTRRLFFLKEGKLRPVDTLSGFRECLLELVDQIVRDSGQPPPEFLPLVTAYLRDSKFKEEIAKLLTQLNQNRTNLSWDKYFRSNSFFIVADGSDAGMIMQWLGSYARPANPHPVRSANGLDFFFKLCAAISTYSINQPNFNLYGAPKLLIGTAEHAFTLDPHHFNEYWQVPSAVHETLMRTGAYHFQKPLSEDQKRRMLLGSVSPQSVDSILTKIGPGKNTAQAFFIAALGVLKPEWHKSFKASLEKVLTEIPVTSLAQAVPFILKQWNLSTEPGAVNNLVTYVEQKKKGELFTPYELAKILRKALIFLTRPSIYLPLQKLENSIRSAFGFPQIIDLGNLNWIGEIHSEKLNYCRCVLHHDFSSGELMLGRRYRGVTELFDHQFLNELYSESTLYFVHK